MDDMVGIVLALDVGLFVFELAFFEVVEESIVGHDVGGVEGALHSLFLLLIHNSKLILIFTPEVYYTYMF